MLIKISIDNFKSFAELTELTMITSSKMQDTLKHRFTLNRNINLLRNAAIYGANASGKSNLIAAFRFFKETLKSGLPINCMHLFCRNQPENEKRESSFELQFSTGTSIYAYGFSVILSQRLITGEWLYKLNPTGDAKPIFERTDGGKIELNTSYGFSEEDTRRIETYIEDFGAPAHMLFLTELNRNKKYPPNSKLSVFKKTYSWLVNNIFILSHNDPITKFEYYYNEETLERVSQMLESFDTGITKVDIKEITADEMKNKLDAVTYEKVMARIKEAMNSSAHGQYHMTMRSDTSIFNIEGSSNTEPRITTIRLRHRDSAFDFDLEEESDGTRRLFDLMDMLLLDKKDVVFIVDELERSLHPKLTQHFVELFNEIHKEQQMQLLFTTHEDVIMDQSLFRRDEIWFVERNIQNISHIYSLDRFKERYDKIVGKAYLEGRYGAIPVFKSFSFEAEES